ncbi:MAG: cysteine desulfurase family protein [Acidobacteriota bacterium]
MKKINLDHLSSSPILSEARESMLAFLSDDAAGNPLSKHFYGEKAKEALEEARASVAGLISAEPREIIFTSCGSESNNMAIKGAAATYAKKGRHIIASPIEHHSVIHPLKTLEKQGFQVSWLNVDKDGLVDPQEVSFLSRDDTILITVMFASNEIGTLEPVREIGRIAREKDILFHTDAVAAVGFVPIDVGELSVDLFSLAGNPFYGPVGSGALYVREGVKMLPLIEGGVQEGGLRAGTHNLPSIVGMGVAAKQAIENLHVRREHLLNLRERLIQGVLGGIQDSFLTGHRAERLPHHASFCFKFIEGEALSLNLNLSGIACSSGSACASEASRISHVLQAINLDHVLAQGSIMFTLGIDNCSEDIDAVLNMLSRSIDKLRKLSPL